MTAKELKTALSTGPVPATFKFPGDLGAEASGAEPYVLFTVRNGLLDGAKSEETIGLYLPPTLKVTYAADYEDFQLTIEKYKAMAGAVGSSIFGSPMPGTIGNIGAGMADNLAGGLLTQQIKDFSYSRRAMVNPHMALLFKGMRFREFNFQFHFMPRNMSESEQMTKIIKAFKKWMHPSQLGAQGDSNVFFGYPYNFDIELFSRPSKNIKDSTLFKLKRTVLMVCDVDYAGSGIPSFFNADGMPVDVRLNLTFKETAVLTREDVEKGY